MITAQSILLANGCKQLCQAFARFQDRVTRDGYTSTDSAFDRSTSSRISSGGWRGGRDRGAWLWLFISCSILAILSEYIVARAA